MSAVILQNNVLDVAVITSSSEQPTSPALNVRSAPRTEPWRSAIGSPQYLRFKLPAAMPIDYLAVVDHNLRKSGTLHWQAWDDAFEGAVQTVDIEQAPTLYDDPTIPVKTYGGVYGGPLGIPQPEALINARHATLTDLRGEVTGGQVTSKFWQLTLTGARNNWAQVGYVYVGLARRYLINNDWKTEVDERSVTEESIGGQEFTDPRASPVILRGLFEFLTEAQRDEADIAQRLYGKRRPFLISVRPGATVAGITTTIYGKYTEISVDHRSFNQNALPFAVREAL